MNNDEFKRFSIEFIELCQKCKINEASTLVRCDNDKTYWVFHFADTQPLAFEEVAKFCHNLIKLNPDYRLLFNVDKR